MNGVANPIVTFFNPHWPVCIFNFQRNKIFITYRQYIC